MSPSVAYQLLFDSLPEDTKAAIQRVYGGPPIEGQPTQELLLAAYIAGFEHACSEMWEPSLSKAQAREAVAALVKKNAGVAA